MKLNKLLPLNDFNSSLQFLFSDIDDTMTDEGLLTTEAYEALWNLNKNKIKVIPVTGRPAGWCEMIARMWPVDGIIGENGAFYFSYKNKKMNRYFFEDEKTRLINQQKLANIQTEIFNKVPKAALSSDQFCRLFDLAIDFCEDITPLSIDEKQLIVDIFNSHGAQAKISSIHINGWFGNYNKVTMILKYLEQVYQIDKINALEICGFSGDSPNDEPSFELFKHSFGVANILNFKDQLKFPPKYISPSKGGKGFVEIAEQIIKKSKITAHD